MYERTIADVVNERRRKLGMSQAQLAARSGVSKMAISKIERGKQNEVTFKNAMRLADALEMHRLCFVIESGLIKT